MQHTHKELTTLVVALKINLSREQGHKQYARKLRRNLQRLPKKTQALRGTDRKQPFPRSHQLP